MERQRKKLTVYQRILRNAERGCGTYLTPEETCALSLDDAIATVAYNDTAEQWEQQQEQQGGPQE